MSNKTTWSSLVEEIASLQQDSDRLKIILELPNCNDCARGIKCMHRPNPGEYNRYNCPLYVKPGGSMK